MTQAEQAIRDVKRLQVGDLKESYVPREVLLNYNLIDTALLKGDAKRLAFRLNCLMDLYYFSIVVLHKNKMSRNPDRAKNLHYQMCLIIMKDGLKEGIEIPRKHFKSTIYSECAPIWWALPFGPREQDCFANAGYSDLYIEWMRRAHSQDIRILLVSETIKNAVKLGVRISSHYQYNDDFRNLFPEILPTEKETWTIDSFHQRRTREGMSHGEGTFDFIGVGGALQSRHYHRIIEDDLVGREARKSQIVMQDTIDYHQVLVGASDDEGDNPGKDFDEIVVGNRWSTDDLNSHIRKEEKYFSWTTHSALGGCCSLHPFGEPIYPEGFTKEKLLRWKRRLGTYHFSCQFLNSPVDPDKAKINMGDLRFFNFERVYGTFSTPKIGKWEDGQELQQVSNYRIAIRHHVTDGDVEKDVFPRNLERFMMVDPNHGGQHNTGEPGRGGRCRHAIAVTGVNRDPRRIYLLDQWADACSIDKFVAKIFFLALKWKLRKVYVEAVASQKFLLYHLNYFVARNKKEYPEIASISFEPLKTPQTVGAKEERIDNFIPIIERHEFWIDSNNSEEFREEAEAWGQKRWLIDLLDIISYGPQLWKFDLVSVDDVRDRLEKQKALYLRRMASVGV